jgi:ATP-dependent phosphoenolpyruvate carboxykinase
MSTEVERGRGLEREGIQTDRVKWNLSTPALYEEAIRRKEGVLAADGPLVCRTGQHTGRSPNDKFVVREPSSEANVWWGKVNRPMDAAQFDALHRDMVESLAGKELYVLDCYAGADPAYRLPVRVINEYAWHNLFCKNLFIDDPAAAHTNRLSSPSSTRQASGGPKAARHGHRGGDCAELRQTGSHQGTSYAGEMKSRSSPS